MKYDCRNCQYRLDSVVAGLGYDPISQLIRGLPFVTVLSQPRKPSPLDK